MLNDNYFVKQVIIILIITEQLNTENLIEKKIMYNKVRTKPNLTTNTQCVEKKLTKLNDRTLFVH